MKRGVAVAAVVCGLLSPATADADWLLTPFIGTAFAGETTLVDLEQGAGQTKVTLGVAGMLLSDHILGLEGVIAHSPGFFQGDSAPLVLDSRVTTYMGTAVLALPLSITRESLRPYAVAGFGLVQARSSDVLGELPIRRDMPGFTVGGGAIGFVTPDVGARFDLRYIRAVGREEGGFVRAGVARLSFWQASVGVIVRLRN